MLLVGQLPVRDTFKLAAGHINLSSPAQLLSNSSFNLACNLINQLPKKQILFTTTTQHRQNGLRLGRLSRRLQSGLQQR